MHQKRLNPQGGFSLLEVLVGLSIFLLVLFGIYQVFDTSQATYASGLKKVDVQQNARFALDEMARRLRVTGYFPENFDATAGNEVANPGRVAVQVATSNALAIYGDLDGSGTSRVFTFCMDGSALRRVAGLVTDATSFTCTQGDILADNSTLTFTYFDQNNAQIIGTAGKLDNQALNGGLPDLSDVTQRSSVRTVVVTLVAVENVPGHPVQRYTLPSSIRLRNLN